MKLEFPGLVRLTRSTTDTAVETLTSAFAEDPCLKHLLGSEDYDPEKARHIHRYSVNLGLRYGLALATSAEAEGVCVWMPPERAMTTAWMFLRAGGLGLGSKVDAGVIGRLKAYGDYSAEIHHRSAPFPHWYLLSIAVDRESQGQGYANRLMRPVMEHFDRIGQPCYLETHNGRNVAFYEKYGFEVAGLGRLPGTDKTHWGMLRMPRKV